MLKTQTTADAVVIGGGISGLFAAYKLAQLGLRPVLFEPKHTGGLVRTKREQGFTLETGAATLVENPEFSRLIDQLGLSNQVCYPAIQKYKQFVWYGARPEEVFRAPPKLIFSSPLIAGTDKFRILKSLAFGCGKITEADLSVREFFTQVAGRSVVDNLLDPVLRGIYGGDLGYLSAAGIFGNLWQHLRSGKNLLSYLFARRGLPKKRIFMLKSGNDSLAQKLADSLQTWGEVRKSMVATIRASDDRQFVVTDSEGSLITTPRIVIATAGSATASFLAELDPGLAQRLAKVRTAPLVVVHLSVTKAQALIPDAFGVLLPGHAKANILGVMFNSQIFPHTAPSDRQLVTVVLGGMSKPEAISFSDKEVEALVRAELGTRFNVHDPELLSIVRWTHAIPQYEVGHLEIVAAMERFEQQNPGLLFVGADRGGVGVGDRIRVVESVLGSVNKAAASTATVRASFNEASNS